MTRIPPTVVELQREIVSLLDTIADLRIKGHDKDAQILRLVMEIKMLDKELAQARSLNNAPHNRRKDDSHA